jgi:hypothetical protein
MMQRGTHLLPGLTQVDMVTSTILPEDLMQYLYKDHCYRFRNLICLRGIVSPNGMLYPMDTGLDRALHYETR